MKTNYLAIPLITILTSFTGSFVTSQGLDWYKTIRVPAWTPTGNVIGAVWTVLFILATISALIFWNSKISDNHRHLVCGLFVLNALANVSWSVLFFGNHLIGAAVWEAGLLSLICLGLIIGLWKISKVASVLIIPYALWSLFASYLTLIIFRLN
ncbi:MAG: tryptophan-rich sensory protein [Patescibacteria group bacterium]|nr:tryptophan-rich sensory protein [Patescibacteria group bacterium]